MTNTIANTNTTAKTNTITSISSTSLKPASSRQLASRGATRGGSRLTDAVRSEWIKLTTVRSPRAILALTVFVGGVASFMVARLVDQPGLNVAGMFGFSAVFTAVFAAVSGILVYTAEAEHHTAQQAFAAQPRRGTVVAAKTIVTAVYTAALGLSGLAAGIGGAVLGGIPAGDTSTIPTSIAWATGFAVLSGVLGLGIGLVARHSAAAISGVLVWWLVIESLVSAFAPERVVRFMPFVAGNGMLDIASEGEAIAFERPITALIFAGYAVAALLLGAVVTSRTDP
jgi:uncharacterized membrane protein YiaA